MAGPSDEPSDAEAASRHEGRLAPQMLMMARALMASPHRNKILLLGIALVVVISATAWGQIRLNAWNRPFYDAIGRKDFREFLAQLVVFGIIAGGLLILNVAQAWLNQAMKVKLREGLVCDLFEEWLKPQRAFRLARGVRPDPDLDAGRLRRRVPRIAVGPRKVEDSIRRAAVHHRPVHRRRETRLRPPVIAEERPYTSPRVRRLA